MLVQFCFFFRCLFTEIPFATSSKKCIHSFDSVFNIFVEMYFVRNDSGATAHNCIFRKIVTGNHFKLRENMNAIYDVEQSFFLVKNKSVA